MRIKIKNVWHQLEPGCPIMIELTEQDKKNISNMYPDAFRYAEFHDDDISTVKEKQRWMNDEDYYKS